MKWLASWWLKRAVKKDFIKLDLARNKCKNILLAKGMTEEQMIIIDKEALEEVALLYTESLEIQPALALYFKKIIEGSKELGYDVA